MPQFIMLAPYDVRCMSLNGSNPSGKSSGNTPAVNSSNKPLTNYGTTSPLRTLLAY
jgi:hypothetical protein